MTSKQRWLRPVRKVEYSTSYQRDASRQQKSYFDALERLLCPKYAQCAGYSGVYSWPSTPRWAVLRKYEVNERDGSTSYRLVLQLDRFAEPSPIK